MANPNSEQLKAIEHTGGVLLKAGAGSGKTFVLKEHMIYLCDMWIREFKQEALSDDFYTYVKSKFREVVLMTFTIKAAGELEIRLNKEFAQKASSCTEEDKKYWEIAVDNLQNLNVSTIHGFCFKLIKQGYFPGVSADQDILSEAEFREEILQILDEWVEKESSKQLEIYEILLKEKKSVENCLVSIFSDPALRYRWKYLTSNKLDDDEDLIKDLLVGKNFLGVFQDYFHPEAYSEFEKKTWYPFIVDFCEVKRGLEISLDSIVELYQYFQKLDFKIPRKPTGKAIPAELVTFYEQVKDLKDYLKKYGEHFYMYKMHFTSRILPWHSMVKELVNYVEARYSKSPGITFSDLEFLVYEGIQNKKVAEKIGNDYRYFIIDEFQDTSFIQFHIIESIIQKDYSRIFCVGDLKQAIYGFRGGELDVFLECEKKVPKNLTLNNNYRSLPNIINFNNIFFDSLFKMGPGFKGHDDYSVPVDYQLTPIEYEYKGKITRIVTDIDCLESEEKLKNSQVDYFEALSILDQIKINQTRNEETAILYKRLKPSLILIDLLIKENIGFTAQIKVPFLEDPLIGVFYSLIEYKFNESEQSQKFLIQMINSYLGLLGSKQLVGDMEIINLFFENSNLLGLYSAFCDFISSLGIHNSNYQNNLNKVMLLCSESLGDLEYLIILLKRQSNSAYSMDFHFGENAKNVQIMTAHASKGLEFENVILGGIYTNENLAQSSNSIGKYPLSFKWTLDIHGKKRFKTPRLLWEEEANKRKEFSEAKRLFYVANTRAQKNLQFAELDFGELKRAKTQNGAWHSGLKAWFDEVGECDLIETRQCNIHKNIQLDYMDKIDLRPPLFHIDSLGLQVKELKSSEYYLPELSVTKFALIEQCPKRFYLQNICKISADEMAEITDISESFSVVSDEEELNSKSFLRNSAERGTEIHQEISDWVNQEVSESEIKGRAVNWAVEKLKNFVDEFELTSEKGIKFEVFGYMISGIPDLILYPGRNDDSVQVWDFKTGRIKESKLGPYWFQLYCYAYAQYVLGYNKYDKPTKLVLCFVDEEKLLEKEVRFVDVENFLQESLLKLNNLSQENLEECEYCPYKLICQK